jgi:hypothetical protein
MIHETPPTMTEKISSEYFNVKDDRILPGARVLVFDRRLYKDDKSTPLSVTMQPAVVLRRYGYRSRRYGLYPDMVDVKFEYDGFVSDAHFTNVVKFIEREEPPRLSVSYCMALIAH